MVERTVLDETKHGARIADILAGPSPRPRLARALYALVASGLVEDAASEELRAMVPEVDARTFRVAMPEPPAAPPPDATGLSTGAEPVAGTLSAPPTARGGPSVTATEAAPSQDFADARADLLRLYEALPRATHYAVLGLRPDASSADVSAAYNRLSADQDRRWKGLEADARLSSAMFTLKLRRREAFEALSDPDRRAAYDRALGQLRPASNLSAPTAALHPELGPDSSAADLVREARRLKDKGDADRALPLLLKAVEKDPKNHTARRELAITLAADPALAPKAERHFLVALEQDPLDTDLRYRLAVFYKKAGLNARALLHLRVVVGRDPNHAAAIRDLRELQAD
jgi:tetratricopeptide (TPR) repeat protein